METIERQEVITSSGAAGLAWIGKDDRGVELEVMAVLLADVVFVVHVMPTVLRRRKP